MEKGGKTCKVNVQHVKIMYLVDELIKYVPDDVTFVCVAKY